jgi:hypothetical protein
VYPAASIVRRVSSPDTELAVASQFDERRRVLVVQAAHHDAVELERSITKIVRGLNPGPRLVEPIAPGHLVKRLRVERVERDVEAGQASCSELARQLAQSQRVCRHVEQGVRAPRVNHAHQLGQIATQRRLTTGKADLAHAAIVEQPGQPGRLLKAQDLIPWQPFQSFGGHAVAASEIAPIGDRYPQVVVISAVRIRPHQRSLARSLEPLGLCSCRLHSRDLS